MKKKKKKDLYLALLPVFKVKNRLMQITKYKATKKDIWDYLANNKWKNSQDLTLSEIVNDIINVDIEKLKNYKE